MTVNPASEPFMAGDVLTCTSDGYPELSYQWTDSDGNVVSTKSTTTLSGGLFNLTCTATGNLIAPCNATNGISGLAVSKYRLEVCMGMGMTGIPWDSHGSHWIPVGMEITVTLSCDICSFITAENI